MGQGTDTSAGGSSMTVGGSEFSATKGGVADFGSAESTFGTGGGSGSGTDSSIWNALLENPEVFKELSGLAGSLAGLMGKRKKLSPQSMQLLSQAMKKTKEREETDAGMYPFMGDALRFVKPDFARTMLEELSIPYRGA